ncbi:LamG domain-containing protein [uncultured Roseobacter sp.]|uniref:LamG domain-containing protein n=1 Tax=uncultured Roseobacter sp. TaxID=114847 RepID=UPI002637673C|nr:LamG domain-containing protein [uncultured Roseobacter sp.]
MRKFLFLIPGVLIIGWGGLVALQEIRQWMLDFSPDFSATTPSAPEDWSFVVLPDPHNAEAYLQTKAAREMTSEADRQALIEEHTRLYGQMVRQFETDILLVPGDLADGEWFTKDLETRFEPQLSYTDRVRAAADIVYGSFFQAAEQAGFKTILVATGDHEYGDDPWVPLSRRDASIPVFRELFASYFGGHVKRTLPENAAYSTPTGTVFEDTSYAVRINNAVFVTVDMFSHTARLPKQALNVLKGDLQTVTGTVKGAHLRWLESVLKAARAEDSIEYVFVQGHLPVLNPVRGRNTSIMYFDDGQHSPFWHLLREYEVDAYFSGEVHTDTLIEDADTSLLQVTTRAGVPRSMVTSVQVDADTFTITQYSYTPDDTLVETGRYTAKTDDTDASSSGVLTPVDLTEPLLNYDFDAVRDNRVPNAGGFGAYYDLVCAPCGVTRENGNSFLTGGAAYITEGYASPTFLRSKPTTVSFRFRSDDQGRGVLFSAANASLSKGFALFLDAGQLEVKHFYKRARVDFDGNLADGAWHHVTLRHSDNAPLVDLQITVDGQPHQLVEWPMTESPSWRDLLLTWRRGLDSPPNHVLSLGGHFVKRDAETRAAFQGDIDDFRLWGRTLDDWETEALVQEFLDP